MPRCEECLHYDLCQALEDNNNMKKVPPIYCGFYKNTADVVPKIEVEKLHEVIFKKEDLMQKIARERNQYSDEVDRLTKIINSYTLQYGTVKDQQAVIDKAKAEVATEIFEEIEKICVGMQDFTDYAELKKKYTEGAQDV